MSSARLVTQDLVRAGLALQEKRTGEAVYGMCTLDVRGRLADKALLAALGWDTGLRLEIRAARPGEHSPAPGAMTSLGRSRPPPGRRRHGEASAG
ncbi:hypothetical protein ACIA5D_00170 [Actinoplanes sp. NPDC051513]|uniref:hypothetical protein n=1 Tax=Actinoplanes sp. NPDC051513 TaxID=3363908 RepID=UPI00378FCB61